MIEQCKHIIIILPQSTIRSIVAACCIGGERLADIDNLLACNLLQKIYSRNEVTMNIRIPREKQKIYARGSVGACDYVHLCAGVVGGLVSKRLFA